MRIAHTLSFSLAVSVCVLCLPPMTAKSQHIPALEIIVKYAKDSPVQAFIDQAQRGDETAAMAEAALSDVAKALSQTSGVPLTYLKSTSGREIVYAIDSPAIADLLTQTLAGLEGVDSIRPASIQEGQLTYPPGPRLIVSLRKKAATVPKADTNCEDLSRWLEETASERTGIPLQVDKLDENLVFLAVNMQALARKLLDHLKAQPDVEYAQPNTMLEKYR